MPSRIGQVVRTVRPHLGESARRLQAKGYDLAVAHKLVARCPTLAQLILDAVDGVSRPDPIGVGFYTDSESRWTGPRVPADGTPLTLFRAVATTNQQFDPTYRGSFFPEIFVSTSEESVLNYLSRTLSNTRPEATLMKLQVPRFFVFRSMNNGWPAQPVLRHELVPDLTPFIIGLSNGLDSTYRPYPLTARG